MEIQIENSTIQGTKNQSNTTDYCGCCYVPYPETSIYVMGVAGLPVICFGLLANILSVMVFLDRNMRHSSVNWYLTARSVTDFLLLITTFSMLSLPRVGELYEYYDAVNVSYFTTPVMYGLALVAQTASIYLTVLMTTHRFIGEISTSIMLVGVVVVFLVCNTLTMVLNVIEVAGYQNQLSNFSLLVDISNLLVAVSCSINIFVYCSFSEKFRVLLKYYCCFGCMKEGEILLSTIN